MANMSGLTCDPAIRDMYEKKFKMTGTQDRLKFIVAKISDDLKSIVLDTHQRNDAYKSNKEAWEAFTKALPNDQPRYGIFLFEETLPDGSVLSKIVFVLWAPDSAPVKTKMMATSSLNAIKSQLNGIQLEIQATDQGERDYHEIFEKIKSRARN